MVPFSEIWNVFLDSKSPELVTLGRILACLALKIHLIQTSTSAVCLRCQVPDSAFSAHQNIRTLKQVLERELTNRCISFFGFADLGLWISLLSCRQLWSMYCAHCLGQPSTGHACHEWYKRFMPVSKPLKISLFSVCAEKDRRKCFVYYWTFWKVLKYIVAGLSIVSSIQQS